MVTDPLFGGYLAFLALLQAADVYTSAKCNRLGIREPNRAARALIQAVDLPAAMVMCKTVVVAIALILIGLCCDWLLWIAAAYAAARYAFIVVRNIGMILLWIRPRETDGGSLCGIRSIDG